MEVISIFINLIAEMARNRLSIPALAEKIGMTVKTLRNKMDGRSSFTLNEMRAIQAVVKNVVTGGQFDLDYLFGVLDDVG